MTNMTDEELKQFLKDNKDRIAALLAEDIPAEEVTEDAPEDRDRIHQIKDKASEMNDRMREKASETKDKVKEKASETKDRTEEVMKDMYAALMDSEAHKHFVRMREHPLVFNFLNPFRSNGFQDLTGPVSGQTQLFPCGLVGILVLLDGCSGHVGYLFLCSFPFILSNPDL